MPIENEVAFILRDDPALEGIFAARGPVLQIRQGYLDVSTRIRGVGGQFFFTYKRRVADGRLVEIETAISEADFDLLWPACARSLTKRRAQLDDFGLHWDIDFYLHADGSRALIKAEVEMPDGMVAPSGIQPLIADHIAFAVPRTSHSYSAYSLSDPDHLAEMARLASQGLQAGRASSPDSPV